MRRDAAEELAYPPENLRWSDDDAPRRFSPAAPDESAMTWPSAIWQGQSGYDVSRHGMLTLNALLAPDLPRPQSANAFFNWSGWTHVWPGLAAGAWAGLGFWAHTEPLHALMAAGFGTVGTVLLGLGAAGTAASNVVTREVDAEPADRAGTRLLLGLGGAAWAGAASTGAGFSGIGCMLAAGTVAAVYGGKWAWHEFARHRAIRAVIDFTAASSGTGYSPVPPGMMPVPMALPENRLPPNPYEHRMNRALSAMRIEGTWFGSPMRVADDVWDLPFELPAGANLSPQALVKKVDVLQNNSGARRVEVRPTHGPKGVFTIYDGPDRTDEDYPWDGTMVTSVEKPFPCARDEAARNSPTDFTEHMLTTGKTRKGKSAFQRYLLIATLECPIVRFGVDCKDGAPGLGLFEPVMYELASDPLDAVRQQYGIKAISSARSQWMRQRGIDEWDLDDGPRIIVAIDEQAELVLRVPQLAPPIIKSNLALVAASKITYMIATQTPSGPVFGTNTDARHQFGKHFAFHNDKEVSRMQFGATAERDGFRVDEIDGVGKFLEKSLASARPYKRKALWVPREMAVERVERYAERVKQLDSMSVEAYQWGVEAFDEAMAQNLNPLESFEPPPIGGGDGGGGRRADSFVDSAQAEERRRSFRLITNYPGTSEPIEMKHLALWNLLGSYGADGAFATDLVNQQLDGFTSESNVRKQLRVWVDRGFASAVKDGRADRFWRPDVVEASQRRDA